MKRKSILIPRVFSPSIPEPYGYIYITTNLVTNSKYIGQHSKTTKDSNYLGSGVILQKAIKKYGKENFISEPIDWAESREELNQKEKFWISFCMAVYGENWYNLADGGEGHTSEEAKRFITENTINLLREHFSGEKNPMFGKGYKLQGENNGMYGKNHTEYTKNKIRTTRKQSLIGTGSNNPFFGKFHSEETKQKLRLANTGRKHSEEWKRIASEQRLGKVWVNNLWDKERWIHPEELESFLNLGWIKGRLSFENRNKFLFFRRTNNMKEDLKIKIKYHNDKYGVLTKIGKIDKGDWVDLYSAEEVIMKQGDFKIISLGISMELPKGYEAHLATRSSTFKTWGILMANSHGIIDESYKGDNDIWKFPALAMRDTTIHKGDKICQFRLVKKMPEVEFIEVEHLGNPSRGGLGSTGTN